MRSRRRLRTAGSRSRTSRLISIIYPARHCRGYGWFTSEDVKASSLAPYEAENTQQTKMPAIIGALQEHIDAEEERLSRQREESWRRQREEGRIRKRQLFEAGAVSGGHWSAVSRDFTAAATAGPIGPFRAKISAGRFFGSRRSEIPARS
jgi:hypothetical protein